MTSTSGMKCIGTGSFTQIHGSQVEEIPDGLTLFVALTPNQFNQLCSDQPVVPDPYSGRFGLRADQLTAVQHAHESMNWRQDGRDAGNDGHVHQKKIVVCTLQDYTIGIFCTHGSRYPREGGWIEPLQRWLFSMEWTAPQRENCHP